MRFSLSVLLVTYLTVNRLASHVRKRYTSQISHHAFAQGEAYLDTDDQSVSSALASTVSAVGE
jgi:hypothetical protein